MNSKCDRTEKAVVHIPEFVFEVSDFPLLGLVVGDQVLELPLDLAPLGLFSRNLLLQFVQLTLQSLDAAVDLRTRQNIQSTICQEKNDPTIDS